MSGGPIRPGAFKSVASKLETLCLQYLRLHHKDHLRNTLVEAPKLKKLVMRGITFGTSSLNGPIFQREYYVTLLDPLIFPALTHCTVRVDDDDLVSLCRP